MPRRHPATLKRSDTQLRLFSSIIGTICERHKMKHSIAQLSDTSSTVHFFKAADEPIIRMERKEFLAELKKEAEALGYRIGISEKDKDEDLKTIETVHFFASDKTRPFGIHYEFSVVYRIYHEPAMQKTSFNEDAHDIALIPPPLPARMARPLFRLL